MIRDPHPVGALEPKLVYRTARGEVSEGEHVVPLGRTRVAREASDLTIVAYGVIADGPLIAYESSSLTSARAYPRVRRPAG